MTVAALLCWFDEPCDWLAGCVASLAKARVAHVVAVDGAYFHYPGALQRHLSPPEQARTIAETARQAGLGCTLHQPAGPWIDNEVEKRSCSFELARATGADWFLVVDADEFVHQAPFDFLQTLEQVEDDMAYVAHVTPGELGATIPSLRLFRNVPGLRLSGAHYRYVTDKAAVGFGNDSPAAMLLDVKLEHRWRNPHTMRRRNQEHYYRRRDELGLEKRPIVQVVEDPV